jgi:enterochelin esterase family protein
MITSGPIKPIKWSSFWGTYESLYPELRSFRDFLLGNNCQLDWLERPEGHSWGLWRASLDRMLEYFFPANPTGVTLDENLIVSNFKLFQNFPNPFNPTTTISYDLPVNDFVTLKIYDVLGNLIDTIVEEHQQAGFHSKLYIPNSTLSSGMYFYSLQLNNKTLTNKMIFIK